ncbi:tripartite tricarboxylate transporter substrate binding protein [Roseomonas sp. OT10]|uniref:tripartite tricarboxylate transporter substrate-binding protein n=1 Tax=Roseomonas cutis TaxID=2897332 RepID=UPI001E4B4CE8|nr:tripartite tricarboxylate transporter substrate-binding protein [Roseomonas sp. OT10]UFN48470.1 tripartite tricarboxylate transporter substrate binding protein [Roseomonas sp. OT10]
MPISRRRTLLAAATLPALSRMAGAQPADWPKGPVRLIVPFPPGGSVDTLARILQPGLQEELGVPIVIENRGGAGGAIGTAAAARAAPDGQTFLLVFDSHAVNPALMPNPGYDARRDFVPVMLLGSAPMLVATPKARPWQGLPELLAAARAKPDTLTYGTIGSGSLAHLAMTLLQERAGVRLVHVPYRGGGPLSTAAASGEVDLVVATNAGLGGQVGQTLRPLAQTGARRSPLFPALPTLGEAGVGGIDARGWWGVLAPSRTPPGIVDRFQAALGRTLARPPVATRLSETLGVDSAASTPAAFGQFLDDQIDTWTRVVRQHDIRPD